MCTMIVQKVPVEGFGRGTEGWFDMTKQTSAGTIPSMHPRSTRSTLTLSTRATVPALV